MASAAALRFGQQLVSTLLPTTVATGSQLVLSPLSVWFALLLVLSGAGEGRVTCAVVCRHTPWIPGQCCHGVGTRWLRNADI